MTTRDKLNLVVGFQPKFTTTKHPTSSEGHLYMMTREQLELLNLEELQRLGHSYGIQPLGSYGKREAWISMLLYFPIKAIDQMRDGVGLRSPGKSFYDLLKQASDLLGSPTDTQMALIRASVKGEKIGEVDLDFYQVKLLELYRVKIAIHQVMDTLTR
jgi:hypothetical protein